MSDVDTLHELPFDDHAISAGDRSTPCADVLQTSNARLARRCARRMNLLSCRCSGCDGDDRFPVILSAADAPLLNTGYDGSGGALASGADPYWEVGQGDASGEASVGSWAPAQVVTVLPGGWAVSPYANASWISNAANSGDDLYFRIRFNLASTVDPSSLAVDMSFYADNRVWEIYVNGTAQSTQPAGAGILPQFPDPPGQPTTGFVRGNEVRIRLDNHWQPCTNAIVVHVKSPGGATGLLAQNTVQVSPEEEARCDCRCDCRPAGFPDLRPCITVRWGDSPCDCMETNDFEVLCITACNCYSDVTFENFSIGRLVVTDLAGAPVPLLPNGTPSVQLIPDGPVCFGDILPCLGDGRPTCVSREVVLYTRGAIGARYRLSLGAICFGVFRHYQHEQCFTFDLCPD